ncbi:MAG: urea ABC transporter permease subunit UrtB [Tagaea sp.]|nr:urea ABC transporter permease subunit UrtB [Tagaea sp.]
MARAVSGARAAFGAAARRGFLAALLVAAVIWAAAGAPAKASDFDAALDRFLADGFSETEAGIGAILAAGEPRGVDVLDALLDRRLFVVPAERGVFVRERGGAARDARTGALVASIPTGATMVRVNNRLRGIAQAALGSMTLLSPDPARRLQAAQAVFRSRDAAALPALDQALARETVPRVRAALREARAAIVLTDSRAADAERIAAIEHIAQIGDQDGIALLRQSLGASQGAVRAAIEAGIARIERVQQMRQIGQTFWFGLSLGSVLLLAAIGLAITFGVMGVINMAHGEMVMIGAYVTFVTQEAFRAHAPHLFDWSLPLALPLAFLITGAVGVAIERGIIRFLYGRPLETLLATFGVSLILQQAVRTVFGPTNREVGAPSYMSGAFEFLGLQITYGRLWILCFAIATFALLLIVLKATSLGLHMRAVTQNRRMAASMGIRTGFVDAMTFGLGSGIAGVAGVALSQIDNVSPNLGQGYIIDSFMVVVFGGVGNLWGTLVAAFTLGIANKLLEPFAGAVLGKILILVALILFVQKRPRGLFALKGRAVEQ